MNKHVKSALLVGSGSVGGFILGALFVGKMVLDSDCLREALEKKIVNDIFGEPKRYGQRVTYNHYYNGESSKKETEFLWNDAYQPVFPTRKEAEAVYDKLQQIATDYGCVTVEDLYDLSGIIGTYQMHGYGWAEEVIKASKGIINPKDNTWTIKLPDPIKLK